MMLLGFELPKQVQPCKQELGTRKSSEATNENLGEITSRKPSLSFKPLFIGKFTKLYIHRIMTKCGCGLENKIKHR